MHDRPIMRQPYFTPLAGEVVELPTARRVGIAFGQGVIIFAAAVVFVIGLIAVWGPR